MLIGFFHLYNLTTGYELTLTSTKIHQLANILVLIKIVTKLILPGGVSLNLNGVPPILLGQLPNIK